MTVRQSITAEQPTTDQIEIIGQAEQKREKTATIEAKILRPGLKMYEWDVNTGIIKPAEIKEQTVLMGRMKSYSGYIEFYKNPGCYYHPALNAENAERHFKKKVKMSSGKTVSEMEKA